jgi:hypothetical protein
MIGNFASPFKEAEIAVHMAAERNLVQARMATLRFDLAHERGYAARSRRVTKYAAGSRYPGPIRIPGYWPTSRYL